MSTKFLNELYKRGRTDSATQADLAGSLQVMHGNSKKLGDGEPGTVQHSFYRLIPIAYLLAVLIAALITFYRAARRACPEQISKPYKPYGYQKMENMPAYRRSQVGRLAKHQDIKQQETGNRERLHGRAR